MLQPQVLEHAASARQTPRNDSKGGFRSRDVFVDRSEHRNWRLRDCINHIEPDRCVSLSFKAIAGQKEHSPKTAV